MITVYLAGGIEGLDPELAAGWRQELIRELGGSIKFLDPMRRQLFQDGGDAEAIVRNDLEDILECDMVVANLLHGTCTGTKMEIGYASALCKAIITLVPESQASHPFYTQLTKVTTNMLDFKAEIAKFG